MQSGIQACKCKNCFVHLAQPRLGKVEMEKHDKTFFRTPDSTQLIEVASCKKDLVQESRINATNMVDNYTNDAELPNIKCELMDIEYDLENNNEESDFEDRLILSDNGDDECHSGTASLNKLKLGSSDNFINVKTFKNIDKKATQLEQLLPFCTKEEVVLSSDFIPDVAARFGSKIEESDEDYVYPGTYVSKKKQKKRTKMRRNNNSNKKIKFEPFSSVDDSIDDKIGNNKESLINTRKSKDTRKADGVNHVSTQCDIYQLDPAKDNIIKEMGVLNNLFYDEVQDIISKRKINFSAFNMRTHFERPNNVGISSSFQPFHIGSSISQLDFNLENNRTELKIVKKKRTQDNTLEIVICCPEQ